METSTLYPSWPVDGYTLAEARERTADRVLLKEWRDRAEGYTNIGPAPSWLKGDSQYDIEADREKNRRLRAAFHECQDGLNAAFRSQLRNRELVAFGRLGVLTAPFELIAPSIWPALTDIGWEQSAAGQTHPGGAIFWAVCVFPILQAPNRADVLAGRSLADVFRDFVLGDPEFRALADDALRADAVAEPMLKEGKFPRGGKFGAQWPMDLGAFPDLARTIGEAGSFWESRPADGKRLSAAFGVLGDRFGHLLEVLRHTEIVAKGTHVQTGVVTPIDAAQWSRPSGWIDVQNGDLLEEIDGKLVARWTGITLRLPALETAKHLPELQAHLDCKPPSKAVEQVRTLAKSYNECVSWLAQEMGASPDRKIDTKHSWWVKAQEKWPGTLSKNSFDDAWAAAVRLTRAAIWASPGAPRQSSRQSPR